MRETKITANVMLGIFNILKQTIKYDINTLEKDELDVLLDSFEEDIEYFESFDRVIQAMFIFKESDYIRVVAEMCGKQYIKEEGVYTKISFEDTNDLMVLYFYSQKEEGKRRRKTKIEIEIELEEALKTENYELAAKLDKRLKKFPKK